MKKIIRIDEQGLFVEDVLIKDDTEIPKNCIEILCPDGFYKPKWDGAQWVEGLTAEEIAAISNAPPQPTEIEQLQQELAGTNAMLLEFMESMLM